MWRYSELLQKLQLYTIMQQLLRKIAIPELLVGQDGFLLRVTSPTFAIFVKFAWHRMLMSNVLCDFSHATFSSN